MGICEIIDRRVSHLSIRMQDRLLNLVGRQSHRMALRGWQRLLKLVYIIPVRLGSVRGLLPTAAVNLADSANLDLRHLVYGETAVRVLVADTFEQSGLDALKSLGCEVLYQPNLTDRLLPDAVRELQADVLVVRSTQVLAGVFAAPSLKLVVRAGAGYNTIDVVAASKRGVYVANCPGQNSVAVSELAFGLILALDRRIADSLISLRRNVEQNGVFQSPRSARPHVGAYWYGANRPANASACGSLWHARHRLEPQSDTPAGRIAGSRASPVDIGSGGRCRHCQRPFGTDPRNTRSDRYRVLCRHAARGLLHQHRRGEVVDQAVLLTAMRERGIKAGLDVYGCEPKTGVAEFSDPIAQEPGFCGTPHIGASTEQAQEAIAAETVRIIRSFMQRPVVPNTVNIAGHTPARCMLTVRHRDQPGVLARILDAISAERINVQEMENVIFEGAEAAVVHIHLERAPPAEMLDALRRNEPDVFEMTLTMLSHMPDENDRA